MILLDEIQPSCPHLHTGDPLTKKFHACPAAAGPWREIDYSKRETLPDDGREVLCIDIDSKGESFYCLDFWNMGVDGGWFLGYGQSITHWAEIVPPEGR